MKTETLLALAGIGATTFTAALALIGAVRQATISSRSAAVAEDQKSRRQAYGACATALTARRNAVTALHQLFLEDELDQAAASRLLDEIEALRADVARAVGSVAIEGPEVVAHRADMSGRMINYAADRYREWTAQVAGGRTLNDLIMDQMQYANDTDIEMDVWVEKYLSSCRDVLHPDDRRTGSRLRRLLRR